MNTRRKTEEQHADTHSPSGVCNWTFGLENYLFELLDRSGTLCVCVCLSWVILRSSIIWHAWVISFTEKSSSHYHGANKHKEALLPVGRLNISHQCIEKLWSNKTHAMALFLFLFKKCNCTHHRAFAWIIIINWGIIKSWFTRLRIASNMK